MTRWVVAALILQAALAITDFLAPDEVIFTSTFVLAPFALAVSGQAARDRGARRDRGHRSRSPAAAGTTTRARTDHLLRITIVAAGSILATLAARAIERSREQRARMALLAAIGNLSGAERTEDAIRASPTRSSRPSPATCWVDLDEPDGEQRRLFEHGPDAPPPGPPRIAAPTRP